MKPKHQRMTFIGIGAVVVSVAAFLILSALEDSLIFFYSPQQMIQKKIQLHKRVRLGGMVMDGSLKKKGLDITFDVTDFEATFSVQYQGLLPDLFREGQGVVMDGLLVEEKLFQAERILAKHDETYMPPEVAKSLKAQGKKLK